MFERTTPKISIVIPSWFKNGQDGRYSKDETFRIADQCLERLINVVPRDFYELIIIDNGSTLNTEFSEKTLSGEVQDYFDKADVLIRHKTNLGFGPAMNDGALLARGEYICFLNNDIYIWDNFFTELIALLENKELDPPPGAVMPNLIKRQYQTDCLLDNGKLDIYKVMNLKKEDIKKPSYDRIEERAEFGSAFLMKKELVDELIKKDGFVYDPQFVGFFCEDRDLWKRLRVMEYDTYRTNKLRILHVGNLTVSKVPDKSQYGVKNRERLKEKWEGK